MKTIVLILEWTNHLLSITTTTKMTPMSTITTLRIQKVLAGHLPRMKSNPSQVKSAESALDSNRLSLDPVTVEVVWHMCTPSASKLG